MKQFKRCRTARWFTKILWRILGIYFYSEKI